MNDFLELGPGNGPLLILAHGAGAAMDSPFMTQMATLLAERGIATARFEFAYMAARRTSEKRRPPPKAETLIPAFEGIIAEIAARHPGRALLIGGKSMGGRVASYCAQPAYTDGRVKGLVCLGYPFHPPNQKDQARTAHLLTLACPALIVQGERDPFGARAEVEAYGLPANIHRHWVGDGDHDFGPRGSSGFTRKGNLAASADAVAAFATSLSKDAP
jgi:uncharacterized protein